MFTVMLIFSISIVNVYAEEVEFPETESEYIYMVDIDTGQVLYTKNGDEQMYPASMTKMMTEIIAIEHLDLDQTVTITQEMWDGLIAANASTAGFYVGSSPTVLDLLYGAALPSGADAVNALAIAVSGNISDFVDLMNEKAYELGMYNTHFENPTGLHDDNHYSTAHDIAILMEYCLENQTFRELIAAETYTTTIGITLYSTSWPYINVEDGYEIPGLNGGKTGYTLQALRCFASNAEINGMNVVLVTGHAESALSEASILYTFLDENITRTNILSTGDIVTTSIVMDARNGANEISFTMNEDLVYDLPIDSDISYVITLNSEDEYLYSPIAVGDNLGTISVIANGIEIASYEWIADKDVSRSTFKHLYRITKDFAIEHPANTIILIVVLVVLLILISVLINERSNRRRRRRRRRKSAKARRL